MAIGLFAALLPFFFNRRFYFYNDEENFYYPYYLEIGRQLRHGHWPLLTLSTLCGGNLSIDWQLGLFNPLSLFSYWLIAPTHNLELTSFFFAGFYITLIALGSYALARSFGLAYLPSLIAAAVLTTNNYVIFFYAGAWLAGLVSWCWLIWTWTALQMYRSSGRSVQLIGFIACAYLTVTSGWPHHTLLLALLMVAYLVEMILAEGIRSLKVIRFILGGISLALLVSPALLPAFLSYSWTSRGIAFFNHDFLTPKVGDLLNSSIFFHLPHMRIYNGPAPVTPLLHLAWFVFPLAPLLNWQGVVRALSGRWALGFFGVVSLLLLFGPESLGPLRYPIRALPCVHTVLLIGFLLAATQPNAFTLSKWRIVGSIGVVLIGLISSVWSRPEFTALHVFGALVSLMLTLGAFHLIRAQAQRFLWVWLILGVLWGYVALHFLYRSNLEVAGPHSEIILSDPLPSAEKKFDGYSYYVGPNPAASWHHWPREMFFAAQGIYHGIDTINGETTLNPHAFSDRISDSLWTDVENPKAVAYLFSINAETGQCILDLMRVNTLLLEKRTTALWAQPYLDDQWKKVEEGIYSIHYEKAQPNRSPSTLSWATPGTQATPTGLVSGEVESLSVTTDAQKGILVFARLWWPGYSANLDGQELPVAPLDGLFVKVSLPARARGLVTLTFVPPGFHLGLGLAGVGLLLLVLTLFPYHRRRA